MHTLGYRKDQSRKMIGLLLLGAMAIATAFMSVREIGKGNSKKAFALACASIAFLSIVTLLANSLQNFGEAPKN
jgi:hypothetical protein